MRRKYAPNALRLRDKLDAAMRRAVAARFTVGFVLLPSTRPPETLVPGHSPNHDVKCLTVFHRLISVPISPTMVRAVTLSIPSMRVRSTPVRRYSWACASKWNGLPVRGRGFPGVGGGSSVTGVHVARYCS